jgi:hypothetical protein
MQCQNDFLHQLILHPLLLQTHAVAEAVVTNKALAVLLSGFSNGTVVNLYEPGLSNLQPADRMCIKYT